MANKKTQKEFYAEIREVLVAQGLDELVEFVDGRVALLNKKAENKKPTKAQEENEGLKAEVLAVVTNENAKVSEIMAKSEVLKNLSNQKVSALLRMLSDDGKVRKVTEGKNTFYVLA
jgi:SpoU rRNA methylase family enzyme